MIKKEVDDKKGVENPFDDSGPQRGPYFLVHTNQGYKQLVTIKVLKNVNYVIHIVFVTPTPRFLLQA